MTRTRQQLILASNSPRRDLLLKQIGLDFEIVSPRIQEVHKPGESPADYACRMAFAKAESVALSYPEGLVLGADTIVLLGQEILGKPRNEKEAEEMLWKLSGKRHQVITGLALRRKQPSFLRRVSVVTFVQFKELSSEDIKGYIDTGEPFDKAGGYGIQGRGAILVRSIEGCYFNVVGLPLATFVELLKEANVSIWS